MVTIHKNVYDACSESHAIAILTEWDMFKDLDWNRIFKSMHKPAFIFDGRNILDKKKIEAIGFTYKGIGKSVLAFHFINYILSKNEEYPYNLEEQEINNSNKSFKMDDQNR